MTMNILLIAAIVILWQIFQWSLAVRNSEHNHESADDVSAYPAARKVSLHNATAISAMARAGAAPKFILETVIQSDPNCNLIPRDVYNAKAVVRETSFWKNIYIDAAG